MNIWNGTTPSRSNLSDVRAPDYFDYLQLVVEIQKLQAFVRDLAQNVQIMPDLETELQRAYDSIESVRSIIEQLTPPEDLQVDIENLDVKINEADTRKQVLKLQQVLESLKNLVATNQRQVLLLQENFVSEVKGFQNKVWSTLTSLQADVIERLDTLEKRVESLSVHVDVAKLLGQLNDQARHQ
jgi:hypothetical protein